MVKKESNGDDDNRNCNDNNSDDSVNEQTSLLLSPISLRRRRWEQQQEHHRHQQHQDHNDTVPFPFGSLASIDELQEQIGELAHDLVTFEPADPIELARELEEYQHERVSDRFENDIATEEHQVNVDEGDREVSESRYSGSTSLLDGLTYPEVQVIESHYTESPEKLGCVALAVLVFYNVSGGPFGVETTVRAGGFFYALLGFLVFPFVWSLQEALMTAELGTTFVEASGGVAWVEEAFGPAAGWMSGYLGWIAGATGTNLEFPLHRELAQEVDKVSKGLQICIMRTEAHCLVVLVSRRQCYLSRVIFGLFISSFCKRFPGY
jgi:hypothetical protein